MNWKEMAANALSETLADHNEELDQMLDKKTLIQILEKPKKKELGDVALPCFILAQKLKTSPVKIAESLVDIILEHKLFERVDAVGPYVNMFIAKNEISAKIINAVITQDSDYGSNNLGAGRKIAIDLSHPNIAKPFSMGHLRSTVIGNSIANLANKNGYQAVRINYLGDWGTQFGKLILAYRKWGNEEIVRANPISELLKLYVRFHAEATEEMIEESRQIFKLLEDGDAEIKKLWQWFRDESIKEFNRIYELLGVSFDSYNGEAFYVNQTSDVIKMLQECNLLTESDGAQIVDLSEHNMPPLLITKSDGATLYATRDLAAALYRKKEYDFAKALYVVGNEQSLYFEQLKLVVSKAGFDWASDMEHVPFGMILSNGKKMSTRKGRVILLEEVLNELIALAATMIEERNPNLQDKEEISKQVGIGAIILHDLKNYRKHDIEFSLEAMLNFDGETGPYLQYTYARSKSLLRKANYSYDTQLEYINDPATWPMISLLAEFPSVINTAWKEFDPSKLVRFALDLARRFNQYYAQVRILTDLDAETKYARLTLVNAICIVLKESLSLLGIQAPEKM